jgi:crotonobetainyl-CoA:carnitine CoA-transferase CaiB-like acyl-CoA transferase
MPGDARGGALDGLLALDLTTGVAGAYAGKLLCDLGTRVVMVEPIGGSPLRARPPFFDGHGSGAMFEHLSGAKESVVPDDHADARRLLASLARQADVLLVDGTSPWQAALPAVLPERTVVVDISPFGRSGPCSGWRGSDIALWAMGGYMYFTGAPDRFPLWLPGSQSSMHAGAHAAFAALVGIHERYRTGHGQAVEISEQEATLTAHAWLQTTWAANGQLLTRVPSDLIQAADDWVYFMRIVPSDNLFVLIERYDMMEEGLTASIPEWFANIPRIFDAVAEWAKEKTVTEIVDFAQELRVAVTPVLDAAAIAADPQMEARDWWERDEDGGVFPGQTYHLSATPSRRRGPAPAAGEHTSSVREEAPAAVPSPPVGLGDQGPPLAGLRVIEVTSNWAGPVCGRFLADLGADIIKIEWATRPATRALVWVGPAPQDFQRQGHHRSLYFNEMNRNKRGFVVDLSQAGGREVFLELVKTADVVIENNSARVMPNLGLDWTALHEVNPRLIMVSMSGYGADGPRRDWVAYGSNIETTSGLTSLTGYPDGLMSRTTLFYADPLAGIHGATAVMAALEHRRHTGEGQWIEMALNECGAAFCCEALLDHQATGTVRRPNGNRDPRFAPQGAYPCAGVDHWVAICVQSDDDWVALAEAMGRSDLAADEGLASREGRAARHDEIDEAIAAWTAGLEQYEVAWDLQRRGVSSAPVLANWQVLPDPHLHRRGFYTDVEYPVVGVYPATTWPWRFERTPARMSRPAPLFSEHNREILKEAGLDDVAIDALYESGITADEPEVP